MIEEKKGRYWLEERKGKMCAFEEKLVNPESGRKLRDGNKEEVD